MNARRSATFEVQPIAGPLDAVVTVPGSKSITNRALLIAALADGTSELAGVLEADDTDAMAGCLAKLGATLSRSDSTDEHAPRTVTVRGNGGLLASATAPIALDARQSGTTARFLPPVLALGRGRYRLDGAEQLRARPFAPLFETLRTLGVALRAAPGDLLPVEVAGGGVPAPWPSRVGISGDVSSQFISGLMMAAPYGQAGLRIEWTTPLVSAPYVTMTASVMTRFGASVTVSDADVLVDPGRYRPVDFRIEADASAASYFLAAAAICGGRVRVDGLGEHSTQGDAAFADVLSAMGCSIRRGADWTEVRGPSDGSLHAIDIDLAEMSDTAPTLAAVAPFATGTTRMRGIGFIRRKESDRIGAVVHELRRIGVDAREEPDGMVIEGRGNTAGGWRSATMATYDDHRLAMSFALIGLRVPGIVIADPGCVAKTFPRYWDVLETLRGA